MTIDHKELRELVKIMRQAERAIGPNASTVDKAIAKCDLLKAALRIERALNAKLGAAA